MVQDAKEWPFFEESKSIRKISCSLSGNIPRDNRFNSPIVKRFFKKKGPFSGILNNRLKKKIKKASLTVEAAIVAPLFFMTVICIASIMGIYSGTLEKMVSLRNTCEKIAMASSVTEDELWIDISEPQSFTPFYMPDGVNVNNFICRGRVRAWTGRSESASSDDENNDSRYVYVTENMSVYHTDSGCSYINLSIHCVSADNVGGQRNSDGEKYKPCEKCMNGSDGADHVYITETGNRYHSSTSCSGLKRTVKMVDISEVGGLKECSRCESHS